MRALPASAALLWIACVPAQAQEPAVILPDQVVTATRVATPLENVPAGVTVIDRATIEAKGYNSLQDALSDVPGVRTVPTGPLGQQTSVFVRGTNSDQVLVLRDGMPINDAADPTAAFNFGTDTLADVERIEIIRGPMAALYGSGAIGGVINLISRRGTQAGVHWEGDLAGGYPALVRGSVTASGIEGPVDFAITAESQSQQGYDVVPRRMTAFNGHAQGFRDRILTMNLGYTPVEGTRLSLFLRGDVNWFGVAPDSPAFNNTDASGKTSSLLGRVGGSTRLFDGVLESSAYLGRLQNDRGYLTGLEADNPNLTTQNDRYHAYRTDAQWNNTLHLDRLAAVPGLTGSALTFGYEYTGDTAKVRVNDNSVFGPTTGAANGALVDNAAYVGLQTTVFQRLNLTSQLRQDWIMGDTPTTWRIGGVYDLRELSTHLKAAYGTAFRAPSVFDRFGINTFFVGNPDLRPERAKGWEVGFVTDVPAFSRTDFASVGVTYFDERVQDLIVSAPTANPSVFTEGNVTSAHLHGIEAEATLRPARWVELHGTYTLVNAASPGNSARIRRPQNQGSADVTLRPMERLKIITTLIYAGPALDFLYDNSGSPLPTGYGQHGLITNVAVNYALRPQVELYLDGFNILNSKYEAANGFQIPGPTVLAGVRVQL